MNTRKMLGLAALAAFALPACDTLAQVDASVAEVCLTYPDLSVPAPVVAAASGSATPTATIVQSFTFDDLAPVHQLLADDATLAFLRAEIRTSSADVLAGIQSASVAIAGAAPTDLPRAVIYQCEGDCSGSDAATLELPASAVTDPLAYMAADSLLIDLAASGTLPDHAWSVDVDVCMSGKIHYELQP